MAQIATVTLGRTFGPRDVSTKFGERQVWDVKATTDAGEEIKFGCFDAGTANLATLAEGKRAQVTFNKTQNGQYTNYTLLSIEAASQTAGATLGAAPAAQPTAAGEAASASGSPAAPAPAASKDGEIRRAVSLKAAAHALSGSGVSAQDLVAYAAQLEPYLEKRELHVSPGQLAAAVGSLPEDGIPF